MNKMMKAAVEAVRNNPNDNSAVAHLRLLAVPKFRELYTAVQKAAKTINRHLGEGKGMPNRAKIALAIGLNADILEFVEIAEFINEPTMSDAAKLASKVVDDIVLMRANLMHSNKKYEHIAFMPDYMTADEANKREAVNALTFLSNINNAVRKAIDTINRHVETGDFDPNTFKIAKSIGYIGEIPELSAKLYNLVGKGVVTNKEMDVLALTADAANKVEAAWKKGEYTTPLAELVGFTFRCENNFTETDGEADDCGDMDDEMN